jgi:hypothetical protein
VANASTRLNRVAVAGLALLAAGCAAAPAPHAVPGHAALKTALLTRREIGPGFQSPGPMLSLEAKAPADTCAGGWVPAGNADKATATYQSGGTASWLATETLMTGRVATLDRDVRELAAQAVQCPHFTQVIGGTPLVMDNAPVPLPALGDSRAAILSTVDPGRTAIYNDIAAVRMGRVLVTVLYSGPRPAPRAFTAVVRAACARAAALG